MHVATYNGPSVVRNTVTRIRGFSGQLWANCSPEVPIKGTVFSL